MNASYGLIYKPKAISELQKAEILQYLQGLHPIWEMRYSENNPPPEGQTQRQLLRPVYWLGNWQFACLDYYHPPKGVENRCVEAEPYPQVLQKIVHEAEDLVRMNFEAADIPRGWHLNTCLINFYGSRQIDEKEIDCARLGEHKDFEPGPIASISFGDRTLIQFVRSQGKGHASQVANQVWLEDRSLQIFGGKRFKTQLFHRVQRVEDKAKPNFKLNLENFTTRRINFTFRYVPDEHIVPYSRLPETARADTLPYMEELAKHSEFFRDALK